jgi:hypothetical protein
MKNNPPIRMFLLGVALACLLAGAWAVRVWLGLKEPLRAKTTEARMLDLMGVLEAEEPQQLDPGSLRRILAKYNRLECALDAWGNPLIVEAVKNGWHPNYTVTSLGRDGRRGSCCQKFVESWDDDAVLSGKDWLQVWYPKAVRRR